MGATGGLWTASWHLPRGCERSVSRVLNKGLSNGLGSGISHAFKGDRGAVTARQSAKQGACMRFMNAANGVAVKTTWRLVNMTVRLD